MECKRCHKEIADDSVFCEHCGKRVRPNKWLLFLIIVLILLLCSGGIWVYLSCRNEGETYPEKVTINVSTADKFKGTVSGAGSYIKNDTVEIIAIANEGCRFVSWNDGNSDSIRKVVADQDMVYMARFDSIASETSLVHGDDVTIPKDEPKVEPKDEPKDETKVEPKDEPKVEPKVEPILKEKNYCFGRYEGNLKNGIPEGSGVMYYDCHIQIAKHDTGNPPHYAETGDYFVGEWGNGDIISGKLYSNGGQLKERIFAPKRFNPYDLHKEQCQ